MKELFYQCVNLLEEIANLTNMSYEEVNIWIFIIIGPTMVLSLLLWSIIITIKYYGKVKRV